MKFLLDTNAVISLIRRHPVFLGHIRDHAPGDFALSAIVAHELFYGAYRSQRIDENLARVHALRFAVLPFDQHDAEAAGIIRARLTTAGTQIGPYDVLIAGQALARGLTLITHNTREFSRVEGLATLDWES